MPYESYESSSSKTFPIILAIIVLGGGMIFLISRVLDKEPEVPGVTATDSGTPEQILEKGRRVRGYLGVQADDLTAQIRTIIEYEGQKGAAVLRVIPESPAAAAGLQEEDVVLRYDGSEVMGRGHLFRMIQDTKVGRKVEFEVWRKGEIVKLETTIVDADEAPSSIREEPNSRTASDQEIVKTIGLQVEDFEMVERVRGMQGVWISAVFPNSLAEKNKMQRLDVIQSINGVRVSSASQFYATLLDSAAVQQTTLTGQRGSVPFRITFPAVPRAEDDAR
jgi:S1-C subfamily serine protease